MNRAAPANPVYAVGDCVRTKDKLTPPRDMLVTRIVKVNDHAARVICRGTHFDGERRYHPRDLIFSPLHFAGAAP